MENSPEIVEAFFVRSGGRIVGPFTRHVLQTMFERGKLSTYAEVSPNRADWWPLSQLGAPFAGPPEQNVPAGGPSMGQLTVAPPQDLAGNDYSPQGSVPVASQSLIAGTADDAPCFYSIDGQVAGQVPLSYVRELARTGRLSPHDRLWIAGTRDWVDAATVTTLAFPSRFDQTAKWGRKSPVLLTCAALLILLLVVGPLVVVFGLAQRRTDQARESARIAKEDFEKEVRLKKEEVARLEKVGTGLAAREDKLINQRLQMESNLEQVRLQYTTIAATGIRDERIRGRIDEIEGQIQDVSSKLESLEADQKANAAELREANAQSLAEQQKGNKTLDEINDKLGR